MTKVEIMQAAFKVWGREFYANTSLSHVARELKVCKSALYRHFRNKHALIEAMTAYFFDDFAEFVRPEYEKALKMESKSESIFIIIRGIAEYLAQNVHIFIFSIIKLQDRQLEGLNIVQELKVRGVDVVNFYHSNKLITRLIYATLVFFMAEFHKRQKSLLNPPSETTISHIIDRIINIINGGLCFRQEAIDALNYDELENRIEGTINTIEDDPLLKAVAGAVAKAGPWEASMEQVAHRSGLSKSSLYGHFKSKQDMLHQLFLAETTRIINFARSGMHRSADPEKQLYLGIFSIVEYLRSKPDILVTLDWLRTRRPNVDPGNMPPPPNTFLQIFEEIDSLHESKNPFNNIPQGVGGASKEGDLWLSPWILFLIINTMMQKNSEQAVAAAPMAAAPTVPVSSAKPMENVSNNDIRFLHHFLTLGIGGFFPDNFQLSGNSD